MRKRLLNFWVDEDVLTRFKRKHQNVSARLRELILSDLNNDIEQRVSRNNLSLFRKIVLEDGLPIQVCGNVGIGKSTLMKKLIETTNGRVFVVFDSHNEYDLPVVQTITDDLSQPCKVVLPEQPSAAKGLFPLYANQILSRRWPTNFCFIIEEAHRYKDARLLLREGRKFTKVVTVSPEPLIKSCKVVRVVA